MNWILKSASVGAMVGSLAAPLYRAQNPTVGVVLDAESAHVSNGPLTSGTSLYGADVVKPESQGHVQLRVRQTRLQLAGQSEAAFFPGANGAVTELRQGTMVVALNTGAESFEVFVSDVRIIPKNERPVLVEATMKAPCDFQIKVMHRHLEATAAKETETLDEGHTYDVTPEFYINDTRNPAISPDASAYHRGLQHSTCALAAKSREQPRFPRRRRFAAVAVTAAIGVGTILVLRETLEVPTDLS
ncbi:MAG TPA: hypothetical protein VLA42_08470 [Verrucomicrobiae bacterium]|nr:hypothetical protein [Verrucomicrobiae bacterium]